MKITKKMNLTELAAEMSPDASMENADEMNALLLEGGFLGDDTGKVPRAEWRYYMKQIGLKLPPAQRGQGRKGLSSEPSVVIQVRVTPAQREKFDRAIGADKFRAWVDRFKEA